MQVVVVDDVVRFALHVWRYLGQSLGFGIGAVPSDRAGRFREDGKPRPLPTADGSAQVWWVPATDGVVPHLEAVQSETRWQRRLYLVDVKSPEPRYRAEVLAWVDGKRRAKPGKRDVVRFVSSYAERIDREVWPKSPATLQWVADQARAAAQARAPVPGRVVGSHGHIDVLVTGAGFELHPEAWEAGAGTVLRHLGFGLPSTGDILWSMGQPFDPKESRPDLDAIAADDERVFLVRAATGFPEPVARSFDNQDLVEAMRTLAGARRLDEWWDLLLETELRGRVQKRGELLVRRRAKGEVQVHEVRMREAFRSAILRHDWGHLGQALAAVRLPWCAWLTTNYTRFADRAIALTSEAKRREQRESENSPQAASPGQRGGGRFARAPTWRLVATAQEAQLLIRELQDRGDDHPWTDGETPLFKLHGDISHLQTMAVAGHDKELFSVLGVPVDSLYQVYDAAEKFLLRLVRDRPKAQIRFHVVGHGLMDETLVSVLARVAKAAGGRAIVRLVAPSPPKDIPELSGLVSLERECTNAESYMATLKASSS